MDINLKLLHAFALVAEHGGFRRAAEAIGRSQSAVSLQVQHLEEQLGVALFRRTTRSVELTPEGERLLGFAQLAIATMNEGFEEIRAAAKRQQEHITLACAPTVAATKLPHILSRFHKAYPAVTVAVRELPAREMGEALRRKDVDIGIGPNIQSESGEFRFRPVLFDELCVILPQEAVGKVAEISLRRIGLMPLAVLTSYANLRELLEAAARELGITLNIRYEVHQVQTQIAFARAGLCAVVVPRIALPDEPALLKRVATISEPSISRAIGIVTLRGQVLSRNSRRLASLVAEQVVQPALGSNNTS